MNGTLALDTPTTRPAWNPMAGVIVAVLLVAALALGFGLRSWTEAAPATPAPVVHIVHEPATPPATTASGGDETGQLRRISGAS